MPKILNIPKSVELKHPNRSKKQLRLVIGTVVKSINIRLRTSHIVNFRVKGIGGFSSHGNKKRKGIKKLMAKDRKRKREQLLIKEFKKENLLWVIICIMSQINLTL